MQSLKLILIGICCFLPTKGVNAEEEKNSVTNDIRVLIDVSGSMKQNDPNNLRIPSIKLLVNLLPANTKAGFWVFAEDTRKLVSSDFASDAWKQQALKKIKKIHSRGLLTDIEKSFQVATTDWPKKSDQHSQHIILLTDGMVDVSKDFMESADSRERIIDTIIPKLQQQGIKVHTIALSENADKVLMEKLAISTNGWHETVSSADQLQRVFLKMFKKAVPQDAVPITGNTFIMDGSIKEFSLLVFRKPDAPMTKIISPDDLELSHIIAPENVKWLNDGNYDLITVKNPEPGRWKIVAETDPDNQVMIVTDLKLNLDDLPNFVGKGEALDIKAFLTDQQQLISRADFLKIVEIKMQQTNPEGKTSEWELQEQENKPGLFSLHLEKALVPGEHVLTITVDGKTFKREISRTIAVVQTLIAVETSVDAQSRIVTLHLIPDKKMLDTGFMSIQALISEPPANEKSIEIVENNGGWKLELEVPEKGKRLMVNFSVMAKTIEGDSITPNIKPVFIDTSILEKQNSLAQQPEENQQEENTETTEQELEEDSDVVEEESTNWLMTGLIILGINVLLIGMGYFIYRWLKKSTLRKQEQLLERLE
jgi:uncharacterized protein (TIGR03503 family)